MDILTDYYNLIVTMGGSWFIMKDWFDFSAALQKGVDREPLDIVCVDPALDGLFKYPKNVTVLVGETPTEGKSVGYVMAPEFVNFTTGDFYYKNTWAGRQEVFSRAAVVYIPLQIKSQPTVVTTIPENSNSFCKEGKIDGPGRVRLLVV